LGRALEGGQWSGRWDRLERGGVRLAQQQTLTIRAIGGNRSAGKARAHGHKTGAVGLQIVMRLEREGQLEQRKGGRNLGGVWCEQAVRGSEAVGDVGIDWGRRWASWLGVRVYD